MATINDRLTEVAQALTPARRRAVYRIVSAALLVLTVQRAVTAEDAAAYLQAAGLALGLVPAELAARNVPTP